MCICICICIYTHTTIRLPKCHHYHRQYHRHYYLSSSNHHHSLWPGGRRSHCSIDHTFYPTTCDRFFEVVYECWDQRYDKETNKGHASCLCVFKSAFQRDLDVCDSCLHQRQRRLVPCEPVWSFWMVCKRWCRWAKNRRWPQHIQQPLVFFGNFHATRMWCYDRAKVCYSASLWQNLGRKMKPGIWISIDKYFPYMCVCSTSFHCQEYCVWLYFLCKKPLIIRQTTPWMLKFEPCVWSVSSHGIDCFRILHSWMWSIGLLSSLLWCVHYSKIGLIILKAFCPKVHIWSCRELCMVGFHPARRVFLYGQPSRLPHCEAYAGSYWVCGRFG